MKTLFSRFTRLSRFTQLAGLGLVLALASTVPTAHADTEQASPTGYYVTGQTKRTGPDGVNYVVLHEMKARTAKDPVSAKNADVSKRFLITLLSEVPCAKLNETFRLGLARNNQMGGAASQARFATLAAACPSGSVKARAQVVLAYQAETKRTTLWVEGKGTATLQGVDNMRALWSIWLGAVENEKTDTNLVSKMRAGGWERGAGPGERA
jgi:hypothetical protein